MSAPSISLQQSTIRGYAKQLRLPTLGGQFARLAEQGLPGFGYHKLTVTQK